MTTDLKSKKRHEVTNTEIKAFNWARESIVGKEMSATELKDFLKNLKYATSGNFIKCITSGENPPIIRIRRGVYTVNPKPVFIDRLKKVWQDYGFYGRNRIDSTDDVQLKLDISRAITLLKSQGYKIQKPVIQYVDC